MLVRRESTESETAAEVADSAAILDRPITPQLSSDEVAGITGERRMSTTPIPQVSDTAAEVADVAAILDKEEATPDISDNEAGRTGERRMSLTPIPQVSDTAAEVADVASKLDEESVSSLFECPLLDLIDQSFLFKLLTLLRISPQISQAPIFLYQLMSGLLYLHTNVSDPMKAPTMTPKKTTEITT